MTPVLESREGGEASLKAGAFRHSREDGDGGEGGDNRWGRERGTVLEIPCERQTTDSTVWMTDGNVLGRLRMLVEAGV